MTQPLRHRRGRSAKTALVALAIACALGVAACDEEGDLTGKQYIDKAIEHRDKNDIRASLIELRNAVRVDPDNPQARALLGDNYLNLGDPVAAEKELLSGFHVFRDRFGEADRRTQGTIRYLVELSESWGKPEKATEYRALLAKPEER